MRRIFGAIRAALAALRNTFKWVLRTTARGAAWVLEHIPGLGSGASVPEAVEDSTVADAARTDERAAADVEEAKRELGAICTAVRRCALARKEGLELPPEDAALLAPTIAKWLRSMRKDEAAILAAGGLEGLRMRHALVESGFEKVPDGVRHRSRVLEDAAARPLHLAEHEATQLAARIRRRRLALPETADEGYQDRVAGHMERGLRAKLKRSA